MATTRNRISEQAMRLYMRSFEREDIKPRIDKREVGLLVDQVASEVLALRTREAGKMGTVDIPSCMIATYEGVSVETIGETHKAVLPAFPLQLPMDIGVWAVKSEPNFIPYIPVKSEFWNLLGSEDEGLLEDTVGFYVIGRKIRFTKQPSATVTIELLINDPSLLGEHDPYPISADMEMSVIEKVVALLHSRGFAPEKPVG